MKSFKTDLIAKELTSTGLWMSNQLIANEDNLAKIEAARYVG